eukprot:Lankesteria_metandrocarpae@DN2423_c0_g1_i1.p1
MMDAGSALLIVLLLLISLTTCTLTEPELSVWQWLEAQARFTPPDSRSKFPSRLLITSADGQNLEYRIGGQYNHHCFLKIIKRYHDLIRSDRKESYTVRDPYEGNGGVMYIRREQGKLHTYWIKSTEYDLSDPVYTFDIRHIHNVILAGQLSENGTKQRQISFYDQLYYVGKKHDLPASERNFYRLVFVGREVDGFVLQVETYVRDHGPPVEIAVDDYCGLLLAWDNEGVASMVDSYISRHTIADEHEGSEGVAYTLKGFNPKHRPFVWSESQVTAALNMYHSKAENPEGMILLSTITLSTISVITALWATKDSKLTSNCDLTFAQGDESNIYLRRITIEILPDLSRGYYSSKERPLLYYEMYLTRVDEKTDTALEVWKLINVGGFGGRDATYVLESVPYDLQNFQKFLQRRQPSNIYSTEGYRLLLLWNTQQEVTKRFEEWLYNAMNRSSDEALLAKFNHSDKPSTRSRHKDVVQQHNRKYSHPDIALLTTPAEIQGSCNSPVSRRGIANRSRVHGSHSDMHQKSLVHVYRSHSENKVRRNVHKSHSDLNQWSPVSVWRSQSENKMRPQPLHGVQRSCSDKKCMLKRRGAEPFFNIIIDHSNMLEDKKELIIVRINDASFLQQIEAVKLSTAPLHDESGMVQVEGMGVYWDFLAVHIDPSAQCLKRKCGLFSYDTVTKRSCKLEVVGHHRLGETVLTATEITNVEFETFISNPHLEWLLELKTNTSGLLSSLRLLFTSFDNTFSMDRVESWLASKASRHDMPTKPLVRVEYSPVPGALNSLFYAKVAWSLLRTMPYTEIKRLSGWIVLKIITDVDTGLKSFVALQLEYTPKGTAATKSTCGVDCGKSTDFDTQYTIKKNSKVQGVVNGQHVDIIFDYHQEHLHNIVADSIDYKKKKVTTAPSMQLVLYDSSQWDKVFTFTVTCLESDLYVLKPRGLSPGVHANRTCDGSKNISSSYQTCLGLTLNRCKRYHLVFGWFR